MIRFTGHHILSIIGHSSYELIFRLEAFIFSMREVIHLMLLKEVFNKIVSNTIIEYLKKHRENIVESI